MRVVGWYSDWINLFNLYNTGLLEFEDDLGARDQLIKTKDDVNDKWRDRLRRMEFHYAYGFLKTVVYNHYF